MFGRRAPHELLRSNALLDPAVAEFSHVTITNPANITLVQDLTSGTAASQSFLTTPSLCFDYVYYQSFDSPSSRSCLTDKDVASLDHRVAESPRYCEWLVYHGPLLKTLLVQGFRFSMDQRKIRRHCLNTCQDS